MRPSSHSLRALRLVGALCILGGSVSLAFGAGAARADTAAPVTWSWYWLDEPKPLPDVCAPDGTCVAGGQQFVQAPNVPVGDFAVASHENSSNKETYLHLDLSEVPAGSTVSGFVLTLTEDKAAGSAGQQAAVIKVYPVEDFFADGAESRPYGERPFLDTRLASVTGARSTLGEWTFDVTAPVNGCIAKEMTSCGIGLIPGGGTFEVVLFGHGPTTNSPAAVAPKANGAITTGGTTTTTTTEPSFTPDTPVATPPADFAPADTSGAFTPSLGVSGVTATTTVSTPVARPRLRRVVAVPRRAPPFAFYLVALGIIAVAASGMFALGEAGEPVESRLGTVLRTIERRRALPDRPS